MVRHRLSHNNVRASPCPCCERSFSRQEHMEQHVRSVHTSDKPYKYPRLSVTNAAPRRKSNPKKHIKSIHKDVCTAQPVLNSSTCIQTSRNCVLFLFFLSRLHLLLESGKLTQFASTRPSNNIAHDSRLKFLSALIHLNKVEH
jgi:hypothetical protein